MAVETSQLATLGRVVEIWRYPVKSMLGERLEIVEITERGLLGDRGYAMIDVETGKVVSAKNPRRWPNLFGFRSMFRDEPADPRLLAVVRITLPSGEELASDDEDIEARLSDAVGRPVKLARAIEAADGASGEGYWPDHDWLAQRDKTFDVELAAGTFFDGSIVHLVTTASLEHLQASTPTSRFDVRRFRPNLLIEPGVDATGLVENGWIGKTISIGDVRLQVERPCPRCVMTTLPQEDLPKDPAILRTAVQQNHGNVGVYATVLRGGSVGRGDEVYLD